MVKQEKQIYNLSSNEVLKKFNASSRGLSEEDAGERRKKYGRNKIEKKQNFRAVKILWHQVNDPLVWILVVAAALALVFKEYRDVIIIITIVAINSIIGFFQEWKAERILDQIKKLSADKTYVLRDNEKKEIDSAELVPGDIAYLSAGDSVPADGYILESYNLRINSFIFTGESRPETKKAYVMAEEKAVMADIDNMVFMGESVVLGEGTFVVTGTGLATELGKLAKLTQEIKDELTPMQKEMRSLSRSVTILAVLIGVLVMIAGQYFKLSLYDNFIFALALAVSVVPEGLPAAISVALSLGMRKLLKSNVLAKKLNAVETLGSVSIICTDKTGTITKNELMVTKVIVGEKILDVSGEGYAPEGIFSAGGKTVDPKDVSGLELLFKIGTLCNDASLVEEDNNFKILGDPTEGAIIVAGKKYNNKENFYLQGETKITENPFSSERMRMSVVYKNKNTISYVKGSPDVMLEISTHILLNGETREMTQEHKKKIKADYDAMSEKALRVLAFAYKPIGGSTSDAPMDTSRLNLEDAETNLIWVGMMAMIDPPRHDVSRAIKECQDLGIKVIMITGDYEITARAIGEQVNLIDSTRVASQADLAINGKELDKLSDRDIYAKIKNGVCIFARIAPEQKLRIANLLKNNKQTIAMTGDGVNDAPALKRADIGVAMGIIGTDVSKEAADMILTDDNFASIVKGVKEGRTIFSNLKKFVHYVFTSNASELFSVLAGVLLGIPSPITAVQILSIDLATDVFPSFALGVEPPEPDAMKKKHTKNSRKLMSWNGFRRIIYIGIIMAVGGVSAFLWSMLRGGWDFGDEFLKGSALYVKSTTVTYAVLAMSQMANLLQSRSETLSPFALGFFKNRFAIFSIFMAFGILLLFMYLPFFQKYLHMSPIDGLDWIMVIATSLAVFFWEEGRKAEEKSSK